MIVCLLEFVALVKESGVENKVNPLLNQPCYMTVCQLCGIAFGLTGNGLNAQLVNLAVRAGREYYTIPQLSKEYMPKRVILIHIQYSGNTYSASFCLVSLQRRIMKEPVKLIFIEIWYIVGVLLTTDAAFTAVTGNILASAGEFIDGKAAVVGTALTFCHAGLKLQ